MLPNIFLRCRNLGLGRHAISHDITTDEEKFLPVLEAEFAE